MKKITLLILFTLFSMISNAQVLLSEGFGGSSVPAGWTVVNRSGTNQWSHSAIDNATPGPMGAMFLAGDNVLPGTGPYEKWLITPELDFTNMTNPMLSFQAKTFLANNQGDKLKVMVTIYDAQGFTDYVLVKEFSEFTQDALNPVSPTQNDWGLNLVDLSGYAHEFSVHVAFVVESTGNGFLPNNHFGDNWLLDNISISERCDPITNLRLNSYGQSFANLSWNGLASNYDIEVVLSGNTPTGVPTHTSTNNFFRVEGLASDTNYTIRVRSNCGYVTGEWVSINVLTTRDYCGGSFYDSGGPNGNYSNNENSIVTMCPENAGDVVQVVFNSFSLSSGDILFVYKGPVATPENLIAQYTGSATPPIILGTLANGGCLTFRHFTNVSGVAAGWDASVLCVPGPACAVPEDVELTNVTADSATFEWTRGFEETQWEVVAQPRGTGNPSAATVVPVTSNPFTINGLVLSTEYEFYVRAVCSPTSSSEWTAPYFFATTQIPANFPFVEDFEGQSSVGIVNGTQTNKWVIGAATGNTGNSAYISNDNGTSNAYTLTSTSKSYFYRDVAIPAGAVQGKLQFDWKAQGQTTVDFLKVWIVPSSYSLVAGTAITTATENVQIGTIYNLNGTTWTRADQEVPLTQYAGTTARLVFEWTNNASSGTQPPAAVDNINFSLISCPRPTNLGLVTATSSSATIRWSAGSNESAWEYYIVPFGEPGPTETTTGVSTTTRTNTVIPNLQEATQYTVYARAICGPGDASLWSEPFTFITSQIPAQMPYVENFDGTTPKIGISNGTQVNKWFLGAAVSNSADKSMYISNNNGVANAYTTGTSSVSHFYRDIEIPAGVSLGNLRFDWRAQGESTHDYIRVWVMPLSYIPSPGVQIGAAEGRTQIGENYNQSATWVQADQDVSLTQYAGSTIRLVFEWRNDGSVGTQPPGAVDNINFTIVTCPKPTALVLNAVTEDTATISWTPGNTETSWEYYIVTAGDPAPTDATVGTPTTTRPLTLTGLVPGGLYDFYVRAICTSPEVSLWSSALSFGTTQIPAALPYNENFDGTTVTIGLSNGTQANKWFLGTAVSSSPDKSMYISNNNGTSNAYTTNTTSVTHFYRDIIVPAGVSVANLRFDWKAQGQSTFDYIRTWIVPTTYTPVPGTQIAASLGHTQLGGNFNQVTSWQTANIDFDITQYAGTTIRLVFEWRNDGSGGTQPPGAIDNIGLNIVTCPTPTAVSVTNVTATTAVVNWTAGATETAWEYFVVPQGQPIPDENTTGTAVTAKPVTLTNLAPSTTYVVYVRAVCDATNKSLWTLPETFSTRQTPAEFPYVENFDGASVPYTTTTGNQVNKWFLGTATFNSPDKSMYISNDEGATNAYTITSSSVTHFYRDISIPTGVALGNLKFDWKAAGEGTSTPYDYIRVWLVPGTHTPTAGTQVSTGNSQGVQIGADYRQSATWTTVSEDVNLTSFVGTTARLVFEWRNDSSGGTQPPGAIDNINFTIVSCPRPTALLINDLRQNSVTIDWTAGNTETAWEYFIVPTGQPAPDDTTVGTPTTSKPLTINGLTENTDYTVYIRAVCSDTDKSLWSLPISFTTSQVPASLPYDENFDGSTVNIGISNGTQVNKWFLGSATFNSSDKSMYISNDNGVSNAYTLTSTSTTQFFRDIEIPEGIAAVNLSFDWKSQGDTNDYFRVWLVPTTYVPVSGTQISVANSGGVQISANYRGQATWQTYTEEVSIAQYSGRLMRLVFEWRNNASGGTQPPAAIDNISVTAVTCPMVKNLDVTGVTENSITVNWLPGNTETQWEVIAVPQGSAAPDANATGQLTTVKPYTITGLSPLTAYTIYVRPVCSDTDKGQWIDVSASTTAIPATLPYDEQFNPGSEFILNNGTQTNKWVIGNAAFTSADTGLYISNVNGATNSYAGFASTVQAYRDIALPANSTEITIAYDWRANGESTFDYLQVFVVPATFTPTAGTLVTEANSGGINISGTRQNLNNSWRRFSGIFDLNQWAGQNVRIVFQWRNDSSQQNQFPAAIDNLSITASPCPKPYNLLSQAPNNSNTVTLTWTPGGTETTWEVIILPSGSPAPGPNTAGTLVTTTSFVFEAENSLLYDFYVRGYCSQTEKSNWAGPQPFSVFTPPGCAQIDVVGVDVTLINNQIYICPDSDTENVTLEANYFGIGATTSYEVTSIDYEPPFPFTGGNPISVSNDDVWSPQVDLPFNFCFFGNAYSKAYVGTNGIISFEPASRLNISVDRCSFTVPDIQLPNRTTTNFHKNAIFLFHDIDIRYNLPAASATYQVLGNYPCRALVVNFKDIPYYQGTNNPPPYEGKVSTFQMVIYEISNIIEIYIDKKPNPTTFMSSPINEGRSVLGIMNQDGSAAYIPPGRNTGVWAANREAWRFSPNGPSDVAISWTHEGAEIGTGNTVTLPVSQTTQVTATATYFACDGSQVVTSSDIDIIVTTELPTLEPNTLYLCTGQNVYDLTLNEDYVLSESNPLHYNVYFYTSEALANANDPTTAILDPENYQGTVGQTIWMNVTSLGGCSIVKQFNLGDSYPLPTFTLQGETTVCNTTTSVITVVPTNNYDLAEAIIVVTDPNGVEHGQSSAQVTLPINGLSGTYTFSVTKGCTGTQTLDFTSIASAPTPTLDVVQTDCTSSVGSIQVTSPLNFSSGVQYSDIFISEITDHETGGTSYIELFNPTAQTVDLANYKLQVVTNSSSCNVPMVGTIAPNSTFIVSIGLDTSHAGIVAGFDSSCQGVNNNDQIIIARADDTRVDVWGYDARVAFTPSAAGYVYRRLNTVNAPSVTFEPSDWSTLSTSNYSDVGTYVPGVYTSASYEYSIDGGQTFQTGTTFTNLAPGSYTVIVRQVGNACLSETVEVVINPQPSNVVTIATDCINEVFTLISETTDPSYLYTWTDQNGLVVGNDTTYQATVEGTYTLTVDFGGGCSATGSITINSVNCSRFIPKGISPNGDGKNDNFEISGLRPKSVKIFNRHGREVYSHGAGYTNQWYGQSKEGNKLPDATYFYVIVADNGEEFTGWVYISREVR